MSIPQTCSAQIVEGGDGWLPFSPFFPSFFGIYSLGGGRWGEDSKTEGLQIQSNPLVGHLKWLVKDQGNLLKMPGSSEAICPEFMFRVGFFFQKSIEAKVQKNFGNPSNGEGFCERNTPRFCQRKFGDLWPIQIKKWKDFDLFFHPKTRWWIWEKKALFFREHGLKRVVKLSEMHQFDLKMISPQHGQWEDKSMVSNLWSQSSTWIPTRNKKSEAFRFIGALIVASIDLNKIRSPSWNSLPMTSYPPKMMFYQKFFVTFFRMVKTWPF